MKSRLLILVFGCGVALSAVAGPVACPDLSTAVQVAPCPSEEELKYTFNGYCADNARMYGKDNETCTSYENYRKLKNVALWESVDGEFHAYLSCDLAPAAVKAAKPQGIAIGKAGKMTRVACDYGPDITFAYRTHAQCKVAGDGKCAVGAACQAICE